MLSIHLGPLPTSDSEKENWGPKKTGDLAEGLGAEVLILMSKNSKEEPLPPSIASAREKQALSFLMPRNPPPLHSSSANCAAKYDTPRHFTFFPMISPH
jgi:hypothetical protein